MKKFLFLLLIPFLGYAGENVKTFSYYTGYLFYQRYLKGSEVPLNFQEVLEGIKEAHEQNKNLELSEEALQEFQKRYHEQIKEEKLAESNRFLKEIAAKEDVKELVKDKLYYKIEKIGSGPEIGENPTVLYKAKTLVDGKEEEFHHVLVPKSISLQSTIEGFSLGVRGMREGETRILYIHPDLAYGSASAKMTPNSLVIFEVETRSMDSLVAPAASP
jgi:peptidylprolyl isomerase